MKGHSSGSSSSVTSVTAPIFAASPASDFSSAASIAALNPSQIQNIIAHLSARLHALFSASVILAPEVVSTSVSIDIFNLPRSGIPPYCLSLSTRTPTSAVWLLDTGATHHTYCLESSFTTLKHVEPLHINLPNGSFVIVNQVGSVVLTKFITLSDVLYIPEFTFNLISVSSLITTHSYTVNFFLNSCVIQDLTRELSIGNGSRVGNLYYLITENFACNSVNFDHVNGKSCI